MTTQELKQELKSVTIRVPTDRLELIGARVSDRDTRTDVLIDLLRHALELPVVNSDLGISAVEQKVSEVNQRVNDLTELINDVRQQITQLDSKLNDDRSEWVTKQIESLESRLSIVEKSKSTIVTNAQLPLNLNTGINEEAVKTQSIEAPFMEVTVLANEEILTTSIKNSNSIQTKLLAKRLNVKPESISKKKKEKPEQEFYDWLQSEDPDKISWQPVGGSLEGYSKGWIPAEATPSELLNRLKEWVAANPE